MKTSALAYDPATRVINDARGLAVARDVSPADAFRIIEAFTICEDLPGVLNDVLTTHIYDADQGEEPCEDDPLVDFINRAQSVTADRVEGLAPASNGDQLYAVIDEILAFRAEEFENDGDVNGADLVDAFASFRGRLRIASENRPVAFDPPPVGAQEIIRELMGAVSVLDTQVSQMKGVFNGDEDETIQDAINDGEEAYGRADLYLKACGAPVPAGLMAAVAVLYSSWDADDDEDAAAVEALPTAMNEALAEVLSYRA